MAKKNNNYDIPVGALENNWYMSGSQNEPFSNDGLTDTYNFYGKHGKLRHSGDFTSSNPYLEQLRNASNNQDLDALYELAVQWEADYANRQLQLQENQAILEEQRAYDSPAAQIARQRAAGINPDIAGASGGSTSSGSQAQLTNPGMADQTGQTKFSNQYDNASLVMEGINTAANVVSSFSGGFSTIMNGLDVMKTLPSRLKLNESQAGLMDAQATEINTLLDGKKQSLDLTNAARGIDNSTAILQQLARFSQLISPDTADFAPHLKALGVEEANIAPYTDIIKQMHNNPEMRAKYATDTLAAKWSEEENAQYTTDLVSRLVTSSIKIKEQEQQFQEDFTAVQARVQAILANDPTYSKNQGELLITDAKQARDQQDFAIQMFQRDVATYGANIQDIAWSIKRSQSTIADIHKKAKKENRQLSPVEKATVEDLQTTIRQMRVLGSQQVQNLYGLEKHANRLKFYSEDRIRPATGESEPLSSLQRHNIESRIVFDDVLTDVKTGTDIALDVTSRVLGALGMAGAAYAGGQGMSKGFTPKRGSGLKVTKDFIDVNGMRVSSDGRVSYTMK